MPGGRRQPAWERLSTHPHSERQHVVTQKERGENKKGKPPDIDVGSSGYAREAVSVAAQEVAMIVGFESPTWVRKWAWP
jgi:hypothetical protein